MRVWKNWPKDEVEAYIVAIKNTVLNLSTEQGSIQLHDGFYWFSLPFITTDNDFFICFKSECTKMGWVYEDKDELSKVIKIPEKLVKTYKIERRKNQMEKDFK